MKNKIKRNLFDKRMLLMVVATILLLSDFIMPIFVLAETAISSDEIGRHSYSEERESSSNFFVRTSFYGDVLSHRDLLFINIDINTVNAEHTEIKEEEKLIFNFSNPSAVYEVMEVNASEGFDTHFDYSYESETGQLKLIFTEDIPDNVAFSIMITISVAGKERGEGENISNITLDFWNLEGERLSVFVVNDYFIVDEIYVLNTSPYNVLSFGGGLQPHLSYPVEDNRLGRSGDFTYFMPEFTLEDGKMYMTWHMIFVIGEDVQNMDGNMVINALDGKILEDSIRIYVQNEDITDMIDSKIEVNYINQSEAVVYFSELNRHNNGDRIVVQFMTEEEDINAFRRVNVGVFSHHGAPDVIYRSEIGVFRQTSQGHSRPIIFLEDKELENGTEHFDLKDDVIANDFFDGDITAQLIIADDGGFNINQDGDYQVIYSVRNSFGITTYRTRNITVYSEVASVTVRYEDKEGEELSKPKILTGPVGSPYEAEAKDIEGWLLIKTPENTTGTFTEEAQEVIFVYDRESAPVTVRYEDKEGEELSEPKILTGLFGTPYETKAKDIEDWLLVKTPENATGIFTGEQQEVIYVYEREINPEETESEETDLEDTEVNLPPADQDKEELPLLGGKGGIPLLGIGLIGLAIFVHQLKLKRN